ncbi:MAG: bifunctional hexulose-6-phosphate synthase/ribonuclease regulator [Methanolinea sp.]|jgi:3-hexulose-6-phosphate synthase/6-phospho-3-hexuloisomerase|nr:bifunctional hexulose-6-phosphate synthase/ribonuclease regulator [Methanolinea sp.]
MKRPILQVALDITELDRAVQIAREAVEGGADWIEAGTPLIKSEGMEAVRKLRALFSGHEIVADMKIADTGTLEVEMAAKAGASVVCILADADDSVISEAVRAADLYGVRLMADLINVHEPLERARELESLGVHIINAHVGIDQQMLGKSSLSMLASLRGAVSVPIAAAGGLDAITAPQAVTGGADIVIVGGSITRSAAVTVSARTIREAIDEPSLPREEHISPEQSIRDILHSVSTPNISDAMHRKGAMEGISSLCGDVRMAGRAVTVQAVAGDWAKPVEAIDVAEPGDVLVINNDGATHVATWGELATLSSMERGLSGVVIDGAARDVDDIRKLRFPVFSRTVVPNAGEPKGFGEINAEIRCGGQLVRPGDWVVGDESGVVVIPRERALEIARRAMEVKKTEARVREEIRRGSTLSRVSDLVRWEKK